MLTTPCAGTQVLLLDSRSDTRLTGDSSAQSAACSDVHGRSRTSGSIRPSAECSRRRQPNRPGHPRERAANGEIDSLRNRSRYSRASGPSTPVAQLARPHAIGLSLRVIHAARGRPRGTTSGSMNEPAARRVWRKAKAVSSTAPRAVLRLIRATAPGRCVAEGALILNGGTSARRARTNHQLMCNGCSGSSARAQVATAPSQQARRS
jgi:hypothetical protein